MDIKYWKLPSKPFDEWYCVVSDGVMRAKILWRMKHLFWTVFFPLSLLNVEHSKVKNGMPFHCIYLTFRVNSAHGILNHVGAIYANTHIKKNFYELTNVKNVILAGKATWCFPLFCFTKCTS